MKERGPSPPTRIFADLPVGPGEPLHFEFDGLARTLAGLPRNPENRTPFSVVVRGRWGRGKTTLLRRVRSILEDEEEGAPSGVRRVKTVWFNAWKYPSEETVLAGLLGALLDRMRSGTLFEQLKILVDEHKGEVARAVLRFAAPAQLGEALFGGEAPRSRFAPAEERRAFHDTFRPLFSQLAYLLFHGAAAVRDKANVPEETLWDEATARGVCLAVFLDDLDRCRRERVAEVLEAINLFLDLPGVCFFLGIDWDRLVTALPEAVQGHAEEFLEKIVQVSFELPEVSREDAAKYLRSVIAGTELEPLLNAAEGEDGDVALLAGALESRHPRHVKRFLNDLSMGLAVLRNTDRLGEGEHRLPEAAVLAWHLLSEVLPSERWRELRALPANVRTFLRQWRESQAKLADKEREAGEVPETVALAHARGLAKHLSVLDALGPAQLASLVQLATPPATELPKAARRPGKLDLLDLAGGAWVELPGGTFRMGADDVDEDERPVHEVTLSPFAISRTPVTNSQYAAYVEATGKELPEHWAEGKIPEGKESHPVVLVSWNDAEALCVWLTEKLGGGHEVQLPTEAQWEFAARGEEGRTYPWGEEEPTPEHANYGENVGDTTPVGAYRRGATPEGALDLAGNVWEWCRDWFGPYPEGPQRDPTGPESGSSRVLRGGALFRPRTLRGAYRYDAHPEFRGGNFGFRVVRVSLGGPELGP